MLDQLVSNALIPDPFIRIGIRRLLAQRLEEIQQPNPEALKKYKKEFIDQCKKAPIAVQTRDANEQHYEVPTEFYLYALGPNLKYSCAYFEEGDDLGEAEEKMLLKTVQTAKLQNGDKILELGCGWGSLSLFMAKKFPDSSITAVSNSATQKKYIDEKAERLGLKNLKIITADMNVFNTEEKFDRVVSVEMFEHMRNHSTLLNKISGWLKPHGTLFVHIFVHKDTPYLFEVKDDSDWMSKYFFSGGMMPSDDYFTYYPENFKLVDHVQYNGIHYSKTAEAWLQNMDKNKKKIREIFENHYGAKDATKWIEYWRIFFMSCSELWKYNDGKEWLVSHYLMEKK